MKIDFELLKKLAAAGAPAQAIILMLEDQYSRGEAKRKHDKEAKIIARAGLSKTATQRDTVRQNRTVRDDKTRQDATIDDTPRARLFREGSAALMTMGRTERAARGLIAGWLKLTNDDDQLVTATILRAQGMAVADAAGWITASLKGKTNGNAKSGIIDAADRAIETLRQSECEATELGSGDSGQETFRLISQR